MDWCCLLRWKFYGKVYSWLWLFYILEWDCCYVNWMLLLNLVNNICFDLLMVWSVVLLYFIGFMIKGCF